MPSYKKPYDEEAMTKEDRNQAELELEETGDLISSKKVEGTKVFGRDGEELGSIDHFMVEKRDGKARYAVMSYGGILGMNSKLYPLPWESLNYDENCGGYVVDIDKERLRADKAPSFEREEEPQWTPEFHEEIRIYYFETV
jgi:hypothetical protein